MQQWRLLSLVLGNLRDSAYGDRLQESEVELWLANEIVRAIQTGSSTTQRVFTAIDAYQTRGSTHHCLYTTHRASVYRSLLVSKIPVVAPAPEAIEIELCLLDIGLRRLELFCSRNRLDLVYYEAQHLHNGPRRLVTDYKKELRYYLDVEKPLIIDRFASALVDADLKPEKAYQANWLKMNALASRTEN